MCCSLTRQQMGVDFLRRDGPGEVVSEQEQVLQVLFELVILVPRRGT